MSSTRGRPRPGPVRRILAAGWIVAAVAVGFTILVWAGADRAAAVVLALVPVAALVAQAGELGRYLDRHIGSGVVGHLMVAVWGSGIAVVVRHDGASVALACGTAALASVTIVVSTVLSTRFPAELAARGFPGAPSVEVGRRLLSHRSMTVTAAAMLTATAVLAAGATTSTVMAVLGVSALSYAATVGTVASDALRRFRGGGDSLRLSVGALVSDFRPEILVHFSGSIRTLYQLDQWMPYIVAGGRRVILVARELETFEAARWGTPAVFVKDFPDLDLVATPTARLALYVNTSTKNNQLVRFDSIVHVQLHHGESDKPPSSSKTMRLYDHHFVAGDAAYERLAMAGIVDGPDSVSLVGRPQTDGLVTGPLGHDTPTVLYAPTWEGYHLDTALSSLSTAGPGLVLALAGEFDIVVRPHPLTGSVDGHLRKCVAQLRQTVIDAGGRWVDAHDESLTDSMNDADVLVTDVSSVLVDFLAADRPAIVLDVSGLGAERFRMTYPSTDWAHVVGADLAGLDAALADAVGADAMAPRRAGARSRLLSHVGKAGERFTEALEALVESAGASAQSMDR